MSSRVQAVEPAPHEFGANLVFTEDDLRPFYAADAAVKAVDGGTTEQIRHGGERYEISLSYQESGLRPWASDEFRLETVREYRVNFERKDGVDECSGSFLIQPRWPDMESKGDSPNPSVPDIVGVNVRVQGSNLPMDEYVDILQAAAESVGIDSGYFAASKVHDYSNIFAFEQYVRVDRGKSERLVGQSGLLRQVFEHVESGRGKRELKEDNTETVGYYNHVKVDSSGAETLMQGHEYGKQIKVYHPKNPRDSPGNPLYHPKVGVSLQPNYNSGGSVPWDSRHELRGELDEILVNVLSWAGLSARAESGTYVSDAYFSADESERSLRLTENPLPAIKRKQEAVVVDGLTANADLNESDTEAMQLVADGGVNTVDELADESDYSKRTIYRVVDRLEGILQTNAGRVGFVSDFIADTVRTTLADAKDAISKDGKSGGSDAFEKWANALGVEVDESDARLELRLGRLPKRRDIENILKEGYRAWCKSGRDGRRFKWARAEFTKDGRLQIQQPIFRE